MIKKKEGGRERRLREETATNCLKAAKLTAATRVTRIYIVAISVLRSIQTFTVDKAAIISSIQLLLLLHINPSLPLYNFLPFFTSHTDIKLLIESTFSKSFMACLEVRPGIYFSH